MDKRWEMLKVTEKDLLDAAEWIQEQRNLDDSCFQFFKMAGKLVAISVNDYEIATVGCFHSIIGLERSLKMHYSQESGVPVAKFSFAELMQKSVDEGVVGDDNFRGGRPTFRFIKDSRKESKDVFPNPKYCEQLASLIPQLRNSYMHGEYIMFEDAVQLSVHLRQFSDALATTKR